MDFGASSELQQPLPKHRRTIALRCDGTPFPVEIALSQGWMHLVESLTDVARILQSYENANAAHRCVPFLIESYEIELEEDA